MMLSEINKAISHLEKGNIILCPTDTIWGISCDALNFEAIEKIYTIKKRDKSKSLVVLVSSVEMLKNYIAEIPKNLESFLNQQKKPTTIVYPSVTGISKNVISENSSIAIRIVKHSFAHKLIDKYNKPIVSTSANFSGKETAKTFAKIEGKLKNSIDFVVDKKFGSNNTESSSIYKYENGEFYIIRK